MLNKNIFLLLLLILVASCSKSNSTKILQTKIDSIQTKKIKIDYQKINLNTEANKLVENWVEYQKFKELIAPYDNISKIDALFGSNQLSDIAQQLKDSIRIEKLQIPAIKIRLNVLHNETLRLADMSTIPSISDEEVSNENLKILNAFSALNLKINNILNQEKLNSEIKEFIEEEKQTDDSLNTDQIPINEIDSIKKK